MKNKKNIIACIFALVALIISIMVITNRKNRFDVNMPISNYDFSDLKEEERYIKYLKKDIYPVKIRSFIGNDVIPANLLNQNITGKEVIELMRFAGYKVLFTSMFDKERTNFDECPVTENFKKKYTTNLLDSFNLRKSDDCKSECFIDELEHNITLVVYGNFKNNEPRYWKTHYFRYTLDNDGNVDDVIFENNNN